MKTGTILTIVVIVVLVGGGFAYWYSMQGSSPTASYQSLTPTTTSTNIPQTDMNNVSSTPNPTSTPAPSPASATTASITISGFAFSPATLTVHKGTTVTWTNQDSAPHTVTGDNGGPASSPLSQGKSYSYTFNTVGSFPYHCTIHPMMKATVTVIN